MIWFCQCGCLGSQLHTFTVTFYDVHSSQYGVKMTESEAAISPTMTIRPTIHILTFLPLVWINQRLWVTALKALLALQKAKMTNTNKILQLRALSLCLFVFRTKWSTGPWTFCVYISHDFTVCSCLPTRKYSKRFDVNSIVLFYCVQVCFHSLISSLCNLLSVFGATN